MITRCANASLTCRHRRSVRRTRIVPPERSAPDGLPSYARRTRSACPPESAYRRLTRGRPLVPRLRIATAPCPHSVSGAPTAKPPARTSFAWRARARLPSVLEATESLPRHNGPLLGGECRAHIQSTQRRDAATRARASLMSAARKGYVGSVPPVGCEKRLLLASRGRAPDGMSTKANSD